ncbi:class I SAM-dependent methyltransferase [Methylovirgula sp. 4M-Z18]|uniref:class I SAM-dependent methyltransferase n=1 Tax=Methylovirgula sp. 4M-Z18 TaxID=2293567 RepID=UPI000E2FE7B6|nr:class I SAM-dependent methyltransferase [Methylovirgula sp. 4M-Z18]RFB81017.1 class I SAM-dependent methyltransferase [Methylovirgula sp. 4M-Z18]
MTPDAAGTADAARLMDRMYRHQRHIYDFTRKFYLLGRDELIRDLAPPTGARVLEIGCGTGRNLIRAGRHYGAVQFYGLDVSAEMLATARAEIARAGLGARVTVVQADATAFDAEALFGVAHFERVFISYALSMIPPWREVLPRAAAALAPGGSLQIVDFGDCGELPGAFRGALKAWLAAFGVHPRENLQTDLDTFAKEYGLSAEFRPLFRRYAFLARLSA